MRDKGILNLKMLAILAILVMIGSCAAMPSAGDVSESDVISSSTMIYVPDDYPTIQEAEDSANAGDTITVRDGIYIENIDVKESHLTIKSENGSANCIVQAKDSNDPVFEVTADYVEINGFNIKGEEVGKLAIIKKEGWIVGLEFVNFSARRLCGGIDLGAADFCNISNNNISLGVIGISLSKSSNNNLINNAISNLSFGIYLVNSSNNTLTNHRISHTNEGIFISSGNSNSLTNNNASSNSYDGILSLASNNNIITNNTVANNNCSGIYLGFSNNNTIYLNNFINNSDNVDSYNSTSIWNSKEKITYIYNEKTYTNYLGNYWDDYLGSDANGDGIGDVPYSINLDKDNYPLTKRFENYTIIPSATTVSDGYVELTLNKMERTDTVPPEFIRSPLERARPPEEGHDFVVINLTLTRIEGRYVLTGSSPILFDDKGNDYTCGCTVQGISFRTEKGEPAKHFEDIEYAEAIEGSKWLLLSEIPKDKVPVRLRFIYSFTESWEKVSIKEGQIEMIFP